MARYVTVEVGCDWDDCTVRVPEGDDRISPTTLSIDGKPPKEFQLCKEHRDEFEEMVLPLMQRGIKIEAPKKAPAKRASRAGGEPSPEDSGGKPQTADPYHCAEGDCGRVLHNRTGMAQHVIRTHGYESLADYEAAHPPVAA